MNTHAEPSPKPYQIFRQRSGTARGQSAPEDHPLSDADVGVVDVRILWCPYRSLRSVSTHPPSVSQRSPSPSFAESLESAWNEAIDDVDDDPKAWGPGFIVVYRVMALGPRGAAREELPIPPSSGRASDEDDSAVERLMHAFDDCMAKKLVDPAWKKSNEVWVTPVCEDAAAVAEKLSGFQGQWHDLILGKPVQYLDGPPLLSDIATEFPLPGDDWFAGIKRLVQVGGILFGLASGQPLLVNACLKSFVHDVILKVVSKEIGALLANTLEPVGTRKPDLEATRTSKELEQQETDLQNQLEIAHDKQEEYGQLRYEYAELNEPWSNRDNTALSLQIHPDMSTRDAAGPGLHSQEEQMAETMYVFGPPDLPGVSYDRPVADDPPVDPHKRPDKGNDKSGPDI